MSDIKASAKVEAWILRTGHGTQVVEHKPPCEIDLWQPLYTEAAMREQLKDCSAAFDRQQEQLDRNAEQLAALRKQLAGITEDRLESHRRWDTFAVSGNLQEHDAAEVASLINAALKEEGK